MAVQIAVIGSGSGGKHEVALAREVGREIARRGAILICGGLRGVMEGAAKGASENGGMTVGILPGDDRGDANPYIGCSVVTGMGHTRNALVVKSADAVIALAGGNGTLSEIALALKMGKRVIAIDSWETIEGVVAAGSPREALDIALRQAR